MEFFKKVINQIFNEKEQKEKKLQQPLYKQLKRSSSFLEQFEIWKITDISGDLLRDLHSTYYKKKKGISSTHNKAVVLDTPYAKGFAFYHHDGLQEKSFAYLQELFKDKVKGLGYRLQNQQLILTDSDSHVEMKERYYLKPPISAQSPIDQMYGNIMIELISHDDYPYLFKLSANRYSSRDYIDALPFEELFDILFKFE